MQCLIIKKWCDTVEFVASAAIKR